MITFDLEHWFQGQTQPELSVTELTNNLSCILIAIINQYCIINQLSKIMLLQAILANVN